MRKKTFSDSEKRNIRQRKRAAPDPDTEGSPKKEKKGDSIKTVDHERQSVNPLSKRNLLSGATGTKKKVKETTIKAGVKVKEFISVWNNSHFPILHSAKSKKDFEAGKQTKLYQETVKLLRHLISGKLYTGKVPGVAFPEGFKKHKMEMSLKIFQRLVNNLEKKAFDVNFLPTNKKYLTKVTLKHFLIGTAPHGLAHSALLEYGLGPARLNTRTRAKDPVLSEVFKDLFLEATGLPDKVLTISDRNHLVGASNKYLDFYNHFKEAFGVYGYTDSVDFLDEYYWKAVGTRWFGAKLKRIPTGYLNSTTLIDKVLVPYFLEIDMLKDHDFADDSVFEE